MAQTESDMKTRILLSAKKLFARQGFEGTSVRQICEDAGANVALVSYYFGGKEKVFLAVFDHFFKPKAMDRLSEVPDDEVEGLRLIVTEIIRFMASDEEISTLIQREIFNNSVRAEQIKQYTYPVWKRIRIILEDGRSKGAFEYESLDHTMMIIIGSVLSVKKIEFFKPLLSDIQLDADQYADLTWQFIARALGVTEREAVRRESSH